MQCADIEEVAGRVAEVQRAVDEVRLELYWKSDVSVLCQHWISKGTYTFGCRR